eukprot:15462295-Alexandrium_andersonii.AAC.1
MSSAEAAFSYSYWLPPARSCHSARAPRPPPLGGGGCELGSEEVHRVAFGIDARSLRWSSPLQVRIASCWLAVLSTVGLAHSACRHSAASPTFGLVSQSYRSGGQGSRPSRNKSAGA